MPMMRVFEVAKLRGVPPKELIATLKDIGIDVPNSFHLVDSDEIIRRLDENAPRPVPAKAKDMPVVKSASQKLTAKRDAAASTGQPPAEMPSTLPSVKLPPTLASSGKAKEPPAPAKKPAAQAAEPEKSAQPHSLSTTVRPPRPERSDRPERPAGRPAGRSDGTRTSRGPAERPVSGRPQGKPSSGDAAAAPPPPSSDRSEERRKREKERIEKERAKPLPKKGAGGKPKRTEIKQALIEVLDDGKEPEAVAPKKEDGDVYTSPSKRYDAIKQKGLAQAAPRKGQKVTFLKKKGGKRDKNAEAVEEPTGPPVRKTITVSGPLTVKELSHETGVKSSEIIMHLMKEFNLMTTLNHSLDVDLVRFVCEHFTIGVEIKTDPGLDIPMTQEETDAATLETRPPVVTIMGHVDHGKTKLLDAIRHTNVVDTESGGITQHIGAYQIEHNGRKITFLDTPGHESFTALRARGAKVTDLAVLVVAADDGVMPQTIEAIDHARDAGVPILVAVNKIDKPSANIDRVKRQLSEKGLQPEEWGGTTVMCEISAKMKLNIEELIDMMFLVTDLQELKANPKRKAVGTVVEAQLDKGKGPAATVLVQTGTLNVGDYIVVGLTAGRIRSMENDLGETLPFAGPSTPVRIFGLDHVPESGDQLFVLEDEKTTREIVAKRRFKDREEKMRTEGRISLDDLFKRIKDGQLKELKVIIKGDVQGSVEAITQALEKIEHPEVRVKVIRSDVGEVSETDVMLAAAASAIIMTFHTTINPAAQAMAQRERVEVRQYDIIYRLIDEVKMAMAGMLAPQFEEQYTGRIEVRKVFASSKLGNIAGSYVEDGEVHSNAIVVVLRGGKQVFKGKLHSLKRFKDNVKSVQQGFECGVVMDGFNEVQEGDKIEFFRLVEKKIESI